MANLIKYQRNINGGLDRAYAESTVRPFGLDQLRLIVFSDHHKGVQDGADDFQQCQTAYLGALEHYLDEGYTLAVLGDVEELWENDADPVLETYQAVLQAEEAFNQAGRYWRFYGNHDDDWSHRDLTEKLLGRIFGTLEVQEGVRLALQSADQTLGEVFLVHGHQGTTMSDRFGAFSRRIVRHIWRPFQRLTRIRTNTPSVDWRLRYQHDIAMYNWAAGQRRVILIAGHTHHTVFPSPRRVSNLTSALEGLRGFAPDSPQVTSLQAELQAARAQEQPSYFNGGCCSFSDGQVTGTEIAEGAIRLVRWTAPEGRSQREQLDHMDVSETLQQTEVQAAPILLETAP